MTLYKSQAEHRFSCLQQQSISYSFHLSLSPQSYTGLSQLQFTLTNPSTQFFIDCSPKKLIKLLINGKLSQKPRHQGSHLYLDEDKLVIGVNHVLVEYESLYDTDQWGLMSFVDVDGKQYLHSQFQPYNANRVFGIFDQLDLRARIALSVTCPIAWTEVLSNQFPVFNEKFEEGKFLDAVPTWHKEELKEFIKGKKQMRMAAFPMTKIMPSYIFCIMAGPYQKITCPITQNIPISLYCSASNLPQVHSLSPYLFEATIQAMSFFQSFFGQPYKFPKYDQIFVHNMQNCAMENIGMVSYHDVYLYGAEGTDERWFDLAETMAHELAHHWFGNFVVIKWWDQLWLKESFAEFFGYYVFECIREKLEHVRFESSMAQFLVKKSEDGYIDDMSVTTHAVRGKVQDTQQGYTIYDGISYAKGASILKQLIFFMGAEKFSAVLKDYFGKFGFKNVTIEDFTGCLEPHFQNQHDITLQEWRKVWLEEASLNQLQPLWWATPSEAQEQQQKILSIIQRPHNHKYQTLRPHKLKIALFKPDCSYDTLQVLIPAKPRIDIPIDPQSAPNYRAILLNYEDQTYAKIKFDPISKQFFYKNIGKIKDLLTRTYLWRNFYDMVADGHIPSTQYIELFIGNIRDEESDTIVERNYQFVNKCVELYTPKEYRDQLYTRLFYFTLQTLQKTGPDRKNRLITLRQNLCLLANTQLAISILTRWSANKHPPLSHHEPTLLNRWTIVYKYFSLDNVASFQKIQMLERQLKIDVSQDANLERLKLMAVVCSDQKFQEYYRCLLDPANRMMRQTRKSLMQGLTSIPNQKRLQKYSSTFPKAIENSLGRISVLHIIDFIDYMLPDLSIEEQISLLKGIKVEEKEFYQVRNKIERVIDVLGKRAVAQDRFRDCL